MPLLISVTSNVGLFFIVIKKAPSAGKDKICMILFLSVFALIAWLPAIIYGTVFNSSGYPIFLRCVNYLIALDATFSNLLLIYFYPSFRNFVFWVITCGQKGGLSSLEDKKENSRTVSSANFVPLRKRLSKQLTAKSLSIRTAMIPKNSTVNIRNTHYSRHCGAIRESEHMASSRM